MASGPYSGKQASTRDNHARLRPSLPRVARGTRAVDQPRLRRPIIPLHAALLPLSDKILFLNRPAPPDVAPRGSPARVEDRPGGGLSWGLHHRRRRRVGLRGQPLGRGDLRSEYSHVGHLRLHAGDSQGLHRIHLAFSCRRREPDVRDGEKLLRDVFLGSKQQDVARTVRSAT